jgi:hypothetical protein
MWTIVNYGELRWTMVTPMWTMVVPMETDETPMLPLDLYGNWKPTEVLTCELWWTMVNYGDSYVNYGDAYVNYGGAYVNYGDTYVNH